MLSQVYEAPGERPQREIWFKKVDSRQGEGRGDKKNQGFRWQDDMMQRKRAEPHRRPHWKMLWRWENLSLQEGSSGGGERQASQGRVAVFLFLWFTTNLSPSEIRYSPVSCAPWVLLPKKSVVSGAGRYSSGEKRMKARTMDRGLEMTWRKGFSYFSWRSVLYTGVLYVVSGIHY